MGIDTKVLADYVQNSTECRQDLDDEIARILREVVPLYEKVTDAANIVLYAGTVHDQLKAIPELLNPAVMELQAALDALEKDDG